MKTVQSINWDKISPYDRYSYFIASKVDRYKTLLTTLEKLGLNSMVITVAGNRHIFIFPPGQKSLQRQGIFPFAGLTPFLLTAHYDRVEGSPGANDNSIAVFHLIRTALYFAKHNIDQWIIVFTDKEELKDGESLESQGSYTLAQKLKSWGLEKAKIFNFDACGIGDTFVFSTLTDSVLGNGGSAGIQGVKQNIAQLRTHALQVAHQLKLDKVLLAPTPFCDDMGFLRAGFAAQTITMLPSAEASQFSEILRNYPEFPKLLISGEIKKSNERRFLPQTWKLLNTPADTPDRLTPGNFDQMIKFIIQLVRG